MKDGEKGERRKLAFGSAEVRSFLDGGKKIVEGLIPYDSKSLPIWGMTEVISRTVFKKTLADGAEVRALWSHDDTRVLGSTKSGTLSLENTDAGLACRCELPDATYTNDLYAIIERGDVTAMSFGFTAVKCAYDHETDTRTLKEVRLHEVSFGVCFPAYPETSSEAYTRGFGKRSIDAARLNGALEKDELREEDRKVIRQAVGALSGLLGGEAAGPEPGESAPGSEGGEGAAGLLLEIEAEIAA